MCAASPPEPPLRSLSSRMSMRRESLRPRKIGQGVVDDVKRTLGTHWRAEMTNFNQKTIAISFFVFFACIAPAITFGAMYAKFTHYWIGAVEMIAATAWVRPAPMHMDSRALAASPPPLPPPARHIAHPRHKQRALAPRRAPPPPCRSAESSMRSSAGSR